MSEPTRIPYRPGYTPPNGPLPQPNAPIRSADAYFTNPDARLRPHSLLVTSRTPYTHFINTDRIEVTQFNFPELHKKFLEMQQRAGMQDNPYKLFIALNLPAKASIHRGRREVTLDLDMLNNSDWASIEFPSGHELGHAWQYMHPKPRVPIRVPDVKPKHRYEAAADIFAMCLTQDREGVYRGMNFVAAGSSEYHPSREVRQKIVRNATREDCDIFDLQPNIPLYLKRREAIPHK